MTRRQFLKRFGALAAAGFLLPKVADAAPTYVVNIPVDGIRQAKKLPAWFWLPQGGLDLTSGYAPAVGDQASAATEQYLVNLGQAPFLGSLPPGFKAYDPIGSGSWSAGSWSLGSGGYSVTPPNISSSHYLVGKSSGKWYWEVTATGAGYITSGGVVPIPSSNAQIDNVAGQLTVWGGTYPGLGPDQMLYKSAGAGTGTWISKTGAGWLSGDTIGCMLDCDNNRFTAFKLGFTNPADYPNATLSY